MRSTKDMFTLRDAAAEFGLSVKRLRALVVRRVIGCVRPGGPRGHILIPKAEIKDHIRRSSRPARGRSWPT